jgi:hypothetical protein
VSSADRFAGGPDVLSEQTHHGILVWLQAEQAGQQKQRGDTAENARPEVRPTVVFERVTDQPPTQQAEDETGKQHRNAGQRAQHVFFHEGSPW